MSASSRPGRCLTRLHLTAHDPDHLPQEVYPTDADTEARWSRWAARLRRKACSAAGHCQDVGGTGGSPPVGTDLRSKEGLALSTRSLGIRGRHARKSVSSSLSATPFNSLTMR